MHGLRRLLQVSSCRARSSECSYHDHPPLITSEMTCGHQHSSYFPGSHNFEMPPDPRWEITERISGGSHVRNGTLQGVIPCFLVEMRGRTETLDTDKSRLTGHCSDNDSGLGDNLGRNAWICLDYSQFLWSLMSVHPMEHSAQRETGRESAFIPQPQKEEWPWPLIPHLEPQNAHKHVYHSHQNHYLLLSYGRKMMFRCRILISRERIKAADTYGEPGSSICLPALRRSLQALAIEAVRRTIAMKAVLYTYQVVRFPYRAIWSLYLEHTRRGRTLWKACFCLLWPSKASLLRTPSENPSKHPSQKRSSCELLQEGPF